tara:strand:- start:1148 stop:1270 length:123 start_codon:yes stop_codon:yes gene_type:complete
MTPYPIYLRPLVRGVTSLSYKRGLALNFFAEAKTKPLETF